MFRGNRAAVGGALWFSEDLGEGLTQVTVRDNDGNHAGGDGGGVYDDTEDGSEVSSTGIRDSSAADGGGVYITGFGDQVASFTDSTISSNHARGHGGGIYNQVPAAATGVRIVRNTAVSGGGGIYEDDTPTTSATFTLMKSLVRANRPDNCAPPGSIAGCTG